MYFRSVPNLVSFNKWVKLRHIETEFLWAICRSPPHTVAKSRYWIFIVFDFHRGTHPSVLCTVHNWIELKFTCVRPNVHIHVAVVLGRVVAKLALENGFVVANRMRLLHVPQHVLLETELASTNGAKILMRFCSAGQHLRTSITAMRRGWAKRTTSTRPWAIARVWCEGRAMRCLSHALRRRRL